MNTRPEWQTMEAKATQILIDVFDDGRARYLFDATFHAKVAEAAKRVVAALRVEIPE